MTRLTDMAAATTLEDLRQLPGQCHELTGDRKGQLALDLAGGKRLIFEPSENPPPIKDDGGLAWERVDAVRVLEITDYH
jgi:toxin HigB-1